MAVNERERDEVTFQIVENIGILNSYPTGWHKELNLVAWNGNPAKYDIRDWDPEHEHMSRGITLHAAEAKKLYELLKPKHMSVRKIESQPSETQQLEEQQPEVKESEQPAMESEEMTPF